MKCYSENSQNTTAAKKTVLWFKNYLTFRTQSVSIGTKFSNMKPTVCGVHQGSILGPLLYVICTNEFSDIMSFENNCSYEIQDQEYLFGKSCPTCGMMVNYADDATLKVTSNSRNSNQTKIIQGLNTIDNYLTSNKLSINRTKTCIQEIMLDKKRAKTMGAPPTLTETEIDGTVKTILSDPEMKLLGITLQHNLLCGAHIDTGGEALLPSVRKKNLVSSNTLGRSKKLLIEGLVISKLIYLITVWSGTT